MNINWYPGHMKKTKDSIEKSLGLVDMVYEIIDARIPLSSLNPDIDKLVSRKPKVMIMNKSDLSDPKINQEWKEYFTDENTEVVLLDSKTGRGLNDVYKASEKLMREKKERLRDRGIDNRNTRVMILGIPNVGKSTFINTVSNRKGAKVGNRPGVTRSNQWIKTKNQLDLLDTPGLLWPKFEDKDVAENLALTGAIKDEILDIETLAFRLIEKLNRIDSSYLENRYKLETDGLETLEIMEEIGRKRGCIIRGGEIDYTKVSNLLLDEFRKGTIGNISLERPNREG